jgi:hypothetical protein
MRVIMRVKLTKISMTHLTFDSDTEFDKNDLLGKPAIDHSEPVVSSDSDAEPQETSLASARETALQQAEAIKAHIISIKNEKKLKKAEKESVEATKKDKQSELVGEKNDSAKEEIESKKATNEDGKAEPDVVTEVPEEREAKNAKSTAKTPKTTNKRKKTKNGSAAVTKAIMPTPVHTTTFTAPTTPPSLASFRQKRTSKWHTRKATR